ncbi:flagellar hook-length control protein FliK [Vibrio chagasii]|nr:flagellar hook-length control protein FliK [Vibrio chagasii]
MQRTQARQISATRAEIQAAQQAPLQLTKELANEQVAEKVQMMMSKNLKNLDIRLDPPELGQPKISKRTMNNDVANVHFTVNSQQASGMWIEQTLPRLERCLLNRVCSLPIHPFNSKAQVRDKTDTTVVSNNQV